MRIGIDYTVTVTERAGLARHTREFVAALLELDLVNDYVLTLTSDAKQEAGVDLLRRATICRLPFGKWITKTGWQELRVGPPLETFTGDLDLYHSPNYLLPPLRRAKGIVTIHDLANLVYPQYTDPGMAGWFDEAVRSSIERAARVITISESTRGELIDRLGISADNIEVIYNGVSERFAPVDEPSVLATVRRRYGVEGPFILSVGSIDPRKNLQRLLEAYSILQQDRTITHKLLLIGERRRWLSEDLFQRVEALDASRSVAFLGYVPEEDLPALISLADVFAFPSLYEGFGIPPLEAMACGTPVVASNAPAMPEVLGDAALLVDPLDVAALADALRRVLVDRELRAELVERGLERSRRFTWANAAKKYLEVYEKVSLGRAAVP